MGEKVDHELVVAPEVHARVRELMRTSSWETLEYLNIPAGNVEFEEVERDLVEPEEAAKVRRETWQAKLEERKEALEAANKGVEYLIHDDEETGNLALFEQVSGGGEKRRMWAGSTVTLAQAGVVREGKKMSVPVYPISYSEWVACYNPEYAEAFHDKGLIVPYAGIGVSVLMETADGFFPLTRRGIETPVYPGRLYSPGGGPRPGESSVEAILAEILEETGLEQEEHFEVAKLRMLALVSDTHFADSEHSRPELVAILPVDVSFRQLETIQHERSVAEGKSQEDVWGLSPVSTYVPSLQKGIVYSGFEMCPPTEAGLAHAALHFIAEKRGMETALQEMEKVMKWVQSFSRSRYTPPITRLPVMQ